MMKQKYQVTDSRTGYKEGSIVELTIEELNVVPFNVTMKHIPEESVEDKALLERILADEARASLSVLLSNLGLSPNRTAKVVEKFSCEALLRAGASNVEIDPLTDAFIKRNFSKKKVSRPKKVTKFKK